LRDKCPLPHILLTLFVPKNANFWSSSVRKNRF
jgi:hypothetical protein